MIFKCLKLIIYQFHTMKNILLSLCIVLCLSIITTSEPTSLTYYTDYEIEHHSDYIEIGITVHCEDSVLKNAVRTAHNVVDKLENIVMSYCQSQAKKKSECDDVFQASKHKIQPKYQLVRKVQTFIAFVVSHQITLQIRKFQGLGRMTDQLLAAGNGLITIDSFDWKSQNEENSKREALKAGAQDGQQICERMGLKMLRIVSVEEVEQKEDNEHQQKDQEEEGGQQQEEEQEEADVIIFKFEVECD